MQGVSNPALFHIFPMVILLHIAHVGKNQQLLYKDQSFPTGRQKFNRLCKALFPYKISTYFLSIFQLQNFALD